ncbi:MAG: hypothetical protein KC421_30715 [Anaerolineales bacterium]|nr:hypothetical protein [Anaerolineales bacterium]
MMLKDSLALQAESQQKSQWPLVAAAAALLLIAAGVWLFLSGNPAGLLQQTPTITQDDLEAEAGVRVSLIAVTGGGGFVDFRIKVVDADKATAFFADPEHAPVLFVEESKTTLRIKEEIAYDIEFEADRAYYLLFPNTEKAVTPGTAVTVIFGETQLEPIAAQ